MWWSSWYANATGAVSATMEAAQTTVASLFKDPPTGSGAYNPDDLSVSDIVRERRSSSPADLFPEDPGPFRVQTDIQQAILTRPKTWDEMSFWEKAKTYVGVSPGAVADTVGLSQRPGSSTPVSGPDAGFPAVGGAVKYVIEGAAGAVGSGAQKALGLPPGGLGPFLSSTLVKVIIGLVVVVVGLFFLMRITNKVSG